MRGLFLVQSVDGAAARYRVGQYLPYLRARGIECAVEAVAATFEERWTQFSRAAEYDFVFLQRKLLPAFWWWRLRRSARKLVFDFDDAIMFRSASKSNPHSRGRMRAFRRTVRGAELVLCGNRFLLEQALDAGGRTNRRTATGAPLRPVVVPTVVDTDCYPEHHSAEPGAVTLGWIGSRSTLRYLEAIGPVLNEIGRTRPGVRLKVVCDRFPEFTGLPVVRVPWSEETEAAELASCDIGLMPLSDDLWSRGKCGLKILQYHAAGIPCVASPVGVNRELINDGATGALATTIDEWVSKLEAMINDATARLSMGRAGRAQVVERWSLAAWQPRLFELLCGVAESRQWMSDAA